MSRAVERYEFGEVLHVGSVHTLRRALDRRDGSRVILKCLDVDAHGEPEAQRLRREFERLRDLDLPGVIKARELLAARAPAEAAALASQAVAAYAALGDGFAAEAAAIATWLKGQRG